MIKLKLKLIIGDMNAKIEREKVYKSTIEKKPNKNGEMLIDFATSRNMVITSTIFPHRDIHNLASSRKTVNQIDPATIEERQLAQ